MSRNLMTTAPSITRRPAFEKSNVELTNALRSNFLASKEAFALAVNGNAESQQTLEDAARKIPYTQWTFREKESLYIPNIDFSESGLAEERSQYDITVKLFFLPGTSSAERCEHSQQAVNLVLRELHVPSIDLLIVSFPGVSFDADDDDDEEDIDWSLDGEGHDIDAMSKTWRALEFLHDKGLAMQIGLAEFGTDRLVKFLPRTRIRPSVDQINVKDCCVVPKSLIVYAKQENIELLTHNDCTNILPGGTIRELLGNGEKGAGVLAGSGEDSKGLRGDIRPQWVVKYTAVVRDRGVIENKGYFAMADIQD